VWAKGGSYFQGRDLTETRRERDPRGLRAKRNGKKAPVVREPRTSKKENAHTQKVEAKIPVRESGKTGIEDQCASGTL